MERSAERREFLGDVITTAVEGGTNYWAQVAQYQYVLTPGELSALTVYCGGQVGEETRAELREMNDDETGYKAEKLVLDYDAVARGIGRIERGEVQLNSSLRSLILEASRENDAGNIDADAADVITQAALLGEVRYG